MKTLNFLLKGVDSFTSSFFVHFIIKAYIIYLFVIFIKKMFYDWGEVMKRLSKLFTNKEKCDKILIGKSDLTGNNVWKR